MPDWALYTNGHCGRISPCPCARAGAIGAALGAGVADGTRTPTTSATSPLVQPAMGLASRDQSMHAQPVHMCGASRGITHGADWRAFHLDGRVADMAPGIWVSSDYCWPSHTHPRKYHWALCCCVILPIKIDRITLFKALSIEYSCSKHVKNKFCS